MINPDKLREIRRVIASVVVVSGDGKILMGRKHDGGVYPGVWHIPGGGVEKGESLGEAARRELREEVGLDLKSLQFKYLPEIWHGEAAKTLPSGERVWVKMRFHHFEVRLPQPAAQLELTAGDDLAEIKWFGSRELRDVEQVPGGREFFEQEGYIT